MKRKMKKKIKMKEKEKKRANERDLTSRFWERPRLAIGSPKGQEKKWREAAMKGCQEGRRGSAIFCRGRETGKSREGRNSPWLLPFGEKKRKGSPLAADEGRRAALLPKQKRKGSSDGRLPLREEGLGWSEKEKEMKEGDSGKKEGERTPPLAAGREEDEMAEGFSAGKKGSGRKRKK